jgi:hypothetical protein
MQMPRPAQLGVIIVPGIRGRWRKSIRLLTRTRRNYRAANTRLADMQMRRATPNCSGRTPHRAANTRLADMQMRRATPNCSGRTPHRAANTRLADMQMRRATPNCSGRTPHRAANTRLADMQMPRPAHGECSRVNQCGNARGQAQGTAPTDSVAPTSVHLKTASTGACQSLVRGQAQGLAPTRCVALILLHEWRSFS